MSSLSSPNLALGGDALDGVLILALGGDVPDGVFALTLGGDVPDGSATVEAARFRVAEPVFGAVVVGELWLLSCPSWESNEASVAIKSAVSSWVGAQGVSGPVGSPVSLLSSRVL